MKKLSDDEVGEIIKRIATRRDRKKCPEVNKELHRVYWSVKEVLLVLNRRAIQFLPRMMNLVYFSAVIDLNDSDLECIGKRCPYLQDLYLPLTVLTKARSSRSKDFSSCDKGFESLGDRGLVGVADGCRELRLVSLASRQRDSDIGVSSLVHSCRKLVKLDLEHCNKITDESLEVISQLQVLEILGLRGCKLVTDLGVSFLANGLTNKSLRCLNLNECDKLKDRGVLSLQQITTLQILDLKQCGNKITDIGGIGLAGLSKLQSLNLAFLTNTGDATIKTIVQNCQNLRDSELRGCGLMTGSAL